MLVQCVKCGTHVEVEVMELEVLCANCEARRNVINETLQGDSKMSNTLKVAEQKLAALHTASNFCLNGELDELISQATDEVDELKVTEELNKVHDVFTRAFSAVHSVLDEEDEHIRSMVASRLAESIEDSY